MPSTKRNALHELLKDLGQKGLVEQHGRDWVPAPTVDFERWAARLEGALTLKAEHETINAVEIVLSRPPEPSVFTQELMSSLRSDWGLLNTESILPAIAQAARERAVIVSPFIDDYGIKRVLNFFRQTPAPDKHLIYRNDKDGVQEALSEAQGELLDLGVQIHRYYLPLPERGNESFHAKIVLADRHMALVGSSNMTRWSMRYSLELGIRVRGHAAGRVADVIDAMLACCS
ncbi:MAG: phospholipase D family protein [Ectothiorhodospiraceae bacterium]|nr:phospholipase D family protein [Ectothiorhodospiraceae bacterium]